MINGETIFHRGGFIEIHTLEGPLVLTACEYATAHRRAVSVLVNRQRVGEGIDDSKNESQITSRL